MDLNNLNEITESAIASLPEDSQSLLSAINVASPSFQFFVARETTSARVRTGPVAFNEKQVEIQRDINGIQVQHQIIEQAEEIKNVRSERVVARVIGQIIRESDASRRQVRRRTRLQTEMALARHRQAVERQQRVNALREEGVTVTDPAAPVEPNPPAEAPEAPAVAPVAPVAGAPVAPVDVLVPDPAPAPRRRSRPVRRAVLVHRPPAEPPAPLAEAPRADADGDAVMATLLQSQRTIIAGMRAVALIGDDTRGYARDLARVNEDIARHEAVRRQEAEIESEVGRDPNGENCSICIRPHNYSSVQLECDHRFHRFCILRWIDSNGQGQVARDRHDPQVNGPVQPRCPLCQHPIDRDSIPVVRAPQAPAPAPAN